MNKKLISILTATAMLAIALLASVNTFAGRVAAQKNSQSPNETIQREVMHELRMLNRYTVFDNIEFAVDGNRVTLEGAVVNPDLKSEAAAVVKTVSGVTEVQNNIKALPASNDDDRIRRAAYRSIYGDSQLTKYGFQSVQAIHIIVDNGHLTLEGTVDSEADKNIAGIRANSVEGAFSMKNNLLVRGER